MEFSIFELPLNRAEAKRQQKYFWKHCFKIIPHKIKQTKILFLLAIHVPWKKFGENFENCSDRNWNPRNGHEIGRYFYSRVFTTVFYIFSYFYGIRKQHPLDSYEFQKIYPLWFSRPLDSNRCKEVVQNENTRNFVHPFQWVDFYQKVILVKWFFGASVMELQIHLTTFSINTDTLILETWEKILTHITNRRFQISPWDSTFYVRTKQKFKIFL